MFWPVDTATFVRKFKLARNWMLSTDAKTGRVQLTVWDRGPDEPPDEYLGPDPDSMTVLEYASFRLLVYDAAREKSNWPVDREMVRDVLGLCSRLV